MNDHPEIPSDEPAIGLSFRVPLDETGREVVFQSHVSADCSEAHLNGLLDKLSRAGERQKARRLCPLIRTNWTPRKRRSSRRRTNFSRRPLSETHNWSFGGGCLRSRVV